MGKKCRYQSPEKTQRMRNNNWSGGYKTILLFLSCFLLAFNNSDAQTAPFRLKIMSFNVCRSGELTGYSVGPFASLIRQYQPDIIALQELDYKTTRNTGIDFTTKLGAALGMFPVFGRTIYYKGGEYGIAVLSGFPYLSVKTEPLPSPAGTKEQRAVLITEIRLPSGQDIRFASTHLDYTNTEERQVQVEKLNEVLQAQAYPVIVAGDFNAWPDSKEISEGMSAWKTISNLEPTVPAKAPRNTIDYIFCYPKDKWRGQAAVSHSNIQLSDHLPISAVVELQ